MDFVFGMDANSALVKRAEDMRDKAWKVLERVAKYTVKTKSRKRPANVKEQADSQSPNRQGTGVQEYPAEE